MLWFPVGVDLVYTPCLNLRRVGRVAAEPGPQEALPAACPLSRASVTST